MATKGKRNVNDTRLEGFFEALGNDLQSFLPRDEAQRFAYDRLAVRARKRARLGLRGLKTKAKDKFLDTNDLVQGVSIIADSQILADARYFILNVLERYTSRLNELLVQESLDVEQLFDLWRFGPGTSNGVKGTHAAEKIAQPMTVTKDCLSLIAALRRKNPYFASYDALMQEGYRIVEGSRFQAVPKNEDTMRTIAIEPSGNMAMQLAAGSYLEGALAMIGLNIQTQQPKNKLLALRGSVTGGMATIDLSSASDMISIALVRELMPEVWFKLLMCIRSPVMEVEGVNVELHMISTMGNGFTFPLMTLILTSLIYGMRAQRAGSPNLFIDWKDTAVYGDDMIVPTSEFSDLCELLTACGLIVNNDKSFSDGPFRESCGGDYYSGIDVTPFYVKSLFTDSEVYVAINQVLEWSGRHTYLVHSYLYLKSLITSPLFVPEWHNPNEGILCASILGRYKYLSQTAEHVRLAENHWFSVPLAIGGYVFSTGPDKEGNFHILFTPRTNKLRVKVRRMRTPRGYLSSWDPRKRSQLVSDRITDFISLVS